MDCGLDMLGRVSQLDTVKQLYLGASEAGVQGTEMSIREYKR